VPYQRHAVGQMLFVHSLEGVSPSLLFSVMTSDGEAMPIPILTRGLVCQSLRRMLTAVTLIASGSVSRSTPSGPRSR
jgi:hypothetical protein